LTVVELEQIWIPATKEVRILLVLLVE